MKKTLFGAVAVLLLATLQFGQILSNTKKLDDLTGRVRWSQCAFDPTGVLWVVYEEDTDGPGHPIWVVSYDGTTVSEPFNVTGSPSFRGLRPGIGTGIKGTIAVVWGGDDPISQVWLRVRDPETKTWLPPQNVSQGNGFQEPNVAVDHDDNIHVAWHTLPGAGCWARSYINGAWTGIKRFSGGKDCTVAVGPNGKAWAVWREKGAGGNYKNFYSTRTPTTEWIPASAVGEGGNSSSHPGVTVGPDNVAVLAYGNIDPENEGPQEMRVKKLLDGSNRVIVWDRRVAHYPRLVVDKNLHMHMVCALGGGDAGNGLRYANNVGGAWNASQFIGSGMNKVVGIATDPFGNVAACQSAWTSDGGSDIWCYSIKPIEPTAPIVAQFTFTPTTGNYPLPVTFTATRVLGANGQEVTYGWDFGDGGTGSGRIASHTYLSAGTFNVTLTIADNVGRTDTETKPIVVDTIPLPEPQFTFSPTTGYPPLPVNFAAAMALGPDGQEVSYAWDFGDGGTGSARTTSHTYLTHGTYNVTLTITDNINRSDSLTKQIVVLKTNPLVPVDISATITLNQFWKSPEITFNLFWASNPDNVPEHIEAYAIYMKEDDGDYVRLLTLSTSTFSVSFKFTDLTKKRSFAVSSLGFGGTESPWGYF